MNVFKMIAFPFLGLAMLAPAHGETQSVGNVQVVSPHTQKSREPATANPDVTYDPWVGNVTSTYAYLGSSSTQDHLYNVSGFNFGTSVPAAISCQLRQSYNANVGWPDQFTCQVISTTATSMLIRIHRVDAAVGWGQNLRVDFIVFSSLN